MKYLWILSEERPKISILVNIIKIVIMHTDLQFNIHSPFIEPIFKDGVFTFTYELKGITCNDLKNIYIVIVSGHSSFVDYLVYHSESFPNPTMPPLCAIEETKTTDKESRNTGVYQRSTKFVFLDHIHPSAHKYMYYNTNADLHNPTDTYVFGTRLLLNLGVKILGFKLNPSIFKPFKNIEGIISFKSKMAKPPAGNVPITIFKDRAAIIITGRLLKNNSLAHDPNIGALSLISKTIRLLGWRGKIVIKDHGLQQKHLTKRNKFIFIANKLDIQLYGLTMPIAHDLQHYWKVDLTSEKHVTILIHMLTLRFSQAVPIYENHAGCERGYFIAKDGQQIQIKKYTDRNKYKLGDKSKIIHLPDLIIYNRDESEIIIIEGKKAQFVSDAIRELDNYDAIEEQYINKYYPTAKEKVRTAVIFGEGESFASEPSISLSLASDGTIKWGKSLPITFKDIKDKLNK